MKQQTWGNSVRKIHMGKRIPFFWRINMYQEWYRNPPYYTAHVWKVLFKVIFAPCANRNGRSTSLVQQALNNQPRMGPPAWFCSDTPSIPRTGSSFQIGRLSLLMVCKTEGQHRLRLLLTDKIMVFLLVNCVQLILTHWEKRAWRELQKEACIVPSVVLWGRSAL